MARNGRRGVIKRFAVRTQVFRGKRTRVGVVAPGIKRGRRRTVSTANPSIATTPS